MDVMLGESAVQVARRERDPTKSLILSKQVPCGQLTRGICLFHGACTSFTIGHYSSYFGLVPSVDIGFTILAVDTAVDAPDLNAYADIALAALVQIQELGYKEANATVAGSYKSSDDAVLSLRLTGSDPGIAISNLFANGTDWLEIIAERAGVERPQDLDLRLCLTGLEEKRADGGKRQVFQGVIQDMGAPVDAGTPTCISWQTVGEIELNGPAVDRFILGFGEDGAVEEVRWEAGGVMFRR